MLRAPFSTCAVFVALASFGCGAEDAVERPEVVRSTVTSVVADEGWSVNYPKQRKLFAIGDLLWLFYSDGSSIVGRTTADGVSWSEPLWIRDGGVFGHRIGFAYDGTRLHYAFSTAIPDGDVYYRRGLPGADGTIAWDAPEQLVHVVAPEHTAMYPKVVSDSDGCAWVGFVLVKGGIAVPPFDSVVSRTETCDGTWTTGEQFPVTLVADNTVAYPDAEGVALVGGGTYWLYNRNQQGARYWGRQWTDAGWLDEERATEEGSSYSLYIATAHADGVELVYGGGTKRHRSRLPSGEFGDETVLTRTAGGHSAITLVGDRDLAVSWIDREERLVFRERIDEEWGSLSLWADAADQGIADRGNGINLNALARSSERWRTAVVYTTGTTPPYTLEFAGLPAN